MTNRLDKDRRSAAMDFLSKISSSTSSLLMMSDALHVHQQQASISPGSATAAAIPSNSQTDFMILDKDNPSPFHAPFANATTVTPTTTAMRHLSLKELSVREKAALDFLGNISFTGENSTTKEGGAGKSPSDHNIPNSTIDDQGSPSDTHPALAMPIPIANALKTGSPSFAMPPTALPWNASAGKSEEDSGVSAPFNDTPISYERNSFYRSPAIPRKSLNRLSNRSARSSEMSMVDQLYVFTTAGGPVSLFSMMPINSVRQGEGKRQRQLKKQKATASSPYYFSPYLEKMGLTTLSFDAVKLQRKKMAESFGSLLEPQGLLGQSPVPELSTYDPYYLDHPDLRTGKNKTVITLPCFLGTIIQPSTASEIKKEINQHFKEAHPDLDSTITLTHIRNLKSSLAKIGVARDLEPSSVAFAHVYLEKLILKNYLNKLNKRLIASCCLLLAVKVNDAKDINYGLLVESMEKELEVPRKDIYATEFSVYTELEFSLFLPVWEVLPHLKRVDAMMTDGLAV